MGALRFLTAIYAIVLVVMILIAIGSLIGLFDNPMIDPGVSITRPTISWQGGAGPPVPPSVCANANDG